MSTIIDLMMAIRERRPVFYHKDTNQFDYFSYSELECGKLDENKLIPYENTNNNIMLPTYEEIDHKEIMRFYVREFVEDKTIRKQLFNILRRDEYMDAFLEKLRELELFDDFTEACWEVYDQIFKECVPWSGWRTHSALFCH